MTQSISPDKIQTWEAVDTTLPFTLADIGTLALSPAVQSGQEEFGREAAAMENWLSRPLEFTD